MPATPPSPTDWLHEIETSLPVATFGRGQSDQEAADERSLMDGVPCARCGEYADRAFVLRGDVVRWLDLCAPCAQWIKTGGQ